MDVAFLPHWMQLSLDLNGDICDLCLQEACHRRQLSTEQLGVVLSLVKGRKCERHQIVPDDDPGVIGGWE